MSEEVKGEQVEQQQQDSQGRKRKQQEVLAVLLAAGKKRDLEARGFDVVQDFAPKCALFARTCEKLLEECGLRDGSMENWLDLDDESVMHENVLFLQKVIEIQKVEKQFEELQQSLARMKEFVEEWREAQKE